MFNVLLYFILPTFRREPSSGNKVNGYDVNTTTLTSTAKITSCCSAEDVNVVVKGGKEQINIAGKNSRMKNVLQDFFFITQG